MMRTTMFALLLATLIVPPAEALETDELLALVAMPLVVDAVSQIAGVPERDLFDLVSLLNDADVDPPHFIETIRYVPVALVVEEDGAFVDYVRIQIQQGVRGVELVRLIEDRYRDTYDLPQAELLVTAPRTVVTGDDYVPVVVRERVTAWRNHPHGGPPGLIKKHLGLQTGAEVVHGTTPGRTRTVNSDRREVVSTVVDPPTASGRSNRPAAPPGQAGRDGMNPNRGPASAQGPGAKKEKPGKGNPGKDNQGKGKGPGR